MISIKVSGRKTTVTDALRDRVNEKLTDALKVFDISPMSADVVLRVEKNRSNPQSAIAEVTVFVRDKVVRVVASATDMYQAIDEAAEKTTRQMRKFKTRLIDKRHNHAHMHSKYQEASRTTTDLADLIDDKDDIDQDDLLVREKYIDLEPMTEEEALAQTDLLGHDFYVFINDTTGLVNVVYHRKNGGYGIIKPKIEELNERE